MAFLIASIFSGCASFTSAMNNIATAMEIASTERRKAQFQSAVDPQMVSALYSIDAQGRESIPAAVAMDGFALESMTAESLTMRRMMFESNNMQQMMLAYSQYAYDGENDSLSQAYIRQAKDRGNTVISFRPAMTLQIHRLFVPPIQPLGGSAEWYDRDVALVEYDPSNRPVTALVRSHQAQTTIGVRSYQYVTLITGAGNMRHFENNVGNLFTCNMQLRRY